MVPYCREFIGLFLIPRVQNPSAFEPAAAAGDTRVTSGRAFTPKSTSHPIVAGAGVFDVPRELRLLPLLAGIGVLFALGLVALVGAVSLAGRQADEMVTAESGSQVARVIQDQTAMLATLTTDWAWWNEGIEKLALAPDRVYADANLGDYTTVNFGLFGSLVISSDDQPIFGYLRGRRLPQDELAQWLDGLRPLVEATRRDSADHPVPATAFIELGGQTVLVAASAMMAEEGSPPVDWPQPAVLLFMRALDRPFLESMAQSAGVEALRLGDFGTANSVLSLSGPHGESAGLLTWQVRLPSQSILLKLWPIGTVITLVMLGFGLLVAVSLVRHARRYHRHRVQQEQRLLSPCGAGSRKRENSMPLSNRFQTQPPDSKPNHKNKSDRPHTALHSPHRSATRASRIHCSADAKRGDRA